MLMHNVKPGQKCSYFTIQTLGEGGVSQNSKSITNCVKEPNQCSVPTQVEYRLILKRHKKDSIILTNLLIRFTNI